MSEKAYDNTVLGAGGYSDSDSAIIFGNSTEAHGAKIINTDSAVKFTNIPNGEDATQGGTTTAGNAKEIFCGDITASELHCENINAGGHIASIGAMVLDEYAQFGNIAEPGDQAGRMYFDGNDFWINT